MKILLTNDDGIHARGLWALYHRLADNHHVTVIAPDRERSAVGHGITLHQPLRAVHISLNGSCGGYAVNGTPADCIKLGISEILPGRPDVVIAGINKGANVGANLNYSGTVAAAKEAALSGTIGIAVSIEGQNTEYYDDAARMIAQLSERVFDRGLPFGTFLNVNIPNRINRTRDMDNIVVLKAAHHMDNGVNLPNIGQKLIAEPFSLTSSLDQPSNINELYSGWNNFSRA